MDFPSFDDFLLSVGEDKVIHWVDNANKAGLKFTLPLSQENSGEFATSIISASMLTVQSMMRDYHDWLIKSIEPKLPR